MSKEFWRFFEDTANMLLQREPSFRKMFEYLDAIPGEVLIV